MADLCLAYSEIVDLVETFMGWTSPTADNKAWALARVNEGLRRFLKGQYRDESGLASTHLWSFLQPTATLSVTKGVSVADGVPVIVLGGLTTTVNIDDAIFNTTNIGSRVVFSATGNSYVIASYTDTTTVVVTGDATGEADDDTVTISPYTIALPSNYGGMIQPVTFIHDGSTLYNLDERDADDVLRLSRDDQTAGTPEYYAIISASVPTSTTNQQWSLMLYPTPDTASTIGYRYRVRVDRATDSANVPPGGADFCDALVECARAAAEYKAGGKTTGQQEARANEAMLDATRFDTEMYGEALQEHVQFSDDDIG